MVVFAHRRGSRMSQPNPKFTEFDPAAARERRGPTPITNLPVNALSGDMDPTRELRALIEQLQLAARDARTQVQVAEGERDNLAAQLEQARRQNEDLRAHFVEITSILRERDSAQEAAARLEREMNEARARLAEVQRQGTELQKQRDDAVRTRDEIVRSRDDFQRQLESLTRTSQDANNRFNDVQRQLFTIRQARDTAQAQNTTLNQKLQASAEKILDLQDQLDASEIAITEARAKAVDPEQLTTLQRERDEARTQSEESASEVTQLRSKVVELTEQKAAALETGNGHASALMVAKEEISRLTGERDHALAEVTAKESLIEEIRNNPDEATAAELEQARAEIVSLKGQRESAEMRVQLMTGEVMEMRQQMQARAEQLSVSQRELEETSERMAQTRSQFAQLTQERNSAVAARDEAMNSIAGAQKQIDRLIRDRDLARQQGSEHAIALEAQIEALRAQLTAYEACDPEAGMRTAEVRHIADRLAFIEEERRELAERLERQRSETIDLGAQLHAAQEQIRELSASLAEARLQSLSAGRGSVQRRTPPISSPTATLRPTTPVEIFDASPPIAVMRQAFQIFSKNPSELRQLSELAAHAQVYSELARTCGLVATQQISGAFAGFAEELLHHPDRITPEILRTLQQTIEFLATLPKLSNLPLAKDPSTVTIYAVDDDADTCECIRVSMEAAMMRTVSVQDPAQALMDLASTPCDLIFLDVSMPGISGFELCTSIRNLALHTHTPIIFLTGLTTAENRAQSSLSGGNEFVGKPFMLSELTVKAMMLMMKAQLHLA